MQHIYDKYGKILYCIRDNGEITDKWDCEVIGHLKSDRITDKFDIDTLYRIRSDGTITDKFDCDIIGHIRSKRTIADPIDYEQNKKMAGGCLESVFYIIFSLVKYIFIIIFMFYKFIFLYMMIPIWSSMTFVLFVAMIICAAIGFELGAFAIAIVASVMEFVSVPYWIILFIQKSKQRLTWKETFKYYGKWFLKGPFAYSDLIELTKRM